MHSFVFQGLVTKQQGRKEGREREPERRRRRRRRREVQEEDCLRTELGEKKQVVYIYSFLPVACLGPFVPVAAAPAGAMEDAFARSVSEVGTLLVLVVA